MSMFPLMSLFPLMKSSILLTPGSKPCYIQGREISGGKFEQNVSTGMSTTLGFVLLSPADARPLSDRLGAFAGRQLAGKPLMDWVVRRATESQQLARVVVVIPEVCDEPGLRELIPPNVDLFISQKQDSLAQLCDCLDEYSADAVMHIRIDAPLIDPSLIDRLMTAVKDELSVDYASFAATEGRSFLHAQLGLIAEFCRTEALKLAHRQAVEVLDRNDPTRFMRMRPEQFQLRLMPLPKALDRQDLRLSLKSQQDWEHAEQVVEALGVDELDWHRIAQLLEQQPALRERMADLNRCELEQRR